MDARLNFGNKRDPRGETERKREGKGGIGATGKRNIADSEDAKDARTRSADRDRLSIRQLRDNCACAQRDADKFHCWRNHAAERARWPRGTMRRDQRNYRYNSEHGTSRSLARPPCNFSSAVTLLSGEGENEKETEGSRST